MGQLAHNLLVFVRLLRASGVATDPERVHLCLRAVERLGLRSRTSLYHAARTTLVFRREDLAAFDRAFAAFWSRGAVGPPHAGRLTSRQTAPAARTPGSAGLPHPDAGYSAEEVLRRKDFGEMSDSELEQVRAMIAELNWRLGVRASRRHQVGAGRRPDYRRSWRANLRFGGEPLKWEYRRRARKPRPLVVIADVSGSMERYSALLLHFLHGLIGGLDQPVEAFVFSTRLSRITRQLEARPVEQALRRVSGTVPDWSGGTRIGKAIKSFNYRWARRTATHAAIVMVISDGLDRGRVDLLATEMARLQRSCCRLIWLNPLLGSPSYQPLARGMRAALPHIDHFMPVHNLLSLEQLAVRLPQLSSRRPLRGRNLPRAGEQMLEGRQPAI